MKILILDTETTGLNPKVDHLLEVAAILWSVDHRSTLMQASTLICNDSPIHNPAEPVNGIPAEVLEFTFNYQAGLKVISQMSYCASYICAHNAKFDQAFCRNLEDLDLPRDNWIDTRDIVYPKSQYCQGRSLKDLAIIHGIPLVNFHRALHDCQVLANLLALVPDLKMQLSKAAQPKVLVKSLENKPGRLSKQHGFRWNSIIPLAWAKYMAEEDIKRLPFKAVKVRP